MLSFLRNLLSWGSKPAPNPPAASAMAAPSQSLEIRPESVSKDLLRYPPYDTGFVFSPITAVLAGQQDLIARINRTTGLGAEEFEQRFRPTIHNLVRFAHLLPATSTAFFRGEGGLLRMSLEIGLFALQTANASVFPISGGVERRYYIQPKWCIATFIAGVCSQLYRAISHMAVVTQSGQQWPSLVMSLADWAEKNGVKTYYVRWLEHAHGSNGQASGAFLVNQVVPTELLQWLNEGSNHVVPAMVSAIAGTDASHRDNPIARIVAPIVSRVIDEDVSRSPLNYGHLQVGVHLEPHIIDAMRRLVREGRWAANRERSPLWTGADGTYLRWMSAAGDIVNFLSADGFAGVPKDPDVLAEILLRAGVAQRKGQQSPFWAIMMPDTGEVIEGTLKLTQPNFLFTDDAQIPSERGFTLMFQNTPNAAKKAGGSGAAPPPPDDFGQIQLSLGEVPDVPPVPPKDKPEKPKAPRTPRPKAPRASEPVEPPAEPAEGGTESTTSAPPAETPPPAAAPTPTTSTSAGSEPRAAGRDLIGMLSNESAWLLGEILKAQRERKLVGTLMWIPTGFGISIEEVQAHGVGTKTLMDELHAKQWLWIDTSKPMRHIHRTAVGEAEYRFLILKPEIARGLGFPEE